jgi:hypothetical protein
MEYRSRTLILGAIIGAATGVAAAMLLNRRAAQNQSTTAITTGEGLKLGVMVIGLLRAISSLGNEER